MADTTIQEGDAVSWKWGNGEPTGTVAEVKTDGPLEIESKGKRVHKNSDPANPAVHVEREGNDVVKRASELTKLDSGTEDAEGETSTEQLHEEQATEQPAEEPASTELPSKEQEKPETAPTARQPEGAETTVTEPAPAKRAPKKRAPRKKSNAAATAGDKRERAAEGAVEGAEGAVVDEGAAEQEVVEKETGKKAKKAKATKADTGEKKHPGRPRKGSRAKRGKAHAAEGEQPHEADVEAMQVDTTGEHAGTGETVEKAKKRGPGRPRKSSASDHPHVEHTAVDEDVPAARTRSKGE
ncbi:hypothetical protein Hypma_001596 [Hypsizygus marmoreus]|uniref:Hypervirulence associated protein TUDOR domain-containing protein n=1 Tax=Hypsizygus marmoreus TaxID=39966 RepID=A0A369J675_HYPMA|nr:hypothetical protein Hypma_001596 [Hypsizygus marmoreus]